MNDSTDSESNLPWAYWQPARRSLFLIPGTGCQIVRHQWMELPMLAEIIQHVNQMAQDQNMPQGLDFHNEWNNDQDSVHTHQSKVSLSATSNSNPSNSDDDDNDPPPPNAPIQGDTNGLGEQPPMLSTRWLAHRSRTTQCRSHYRAVN